MLNSPQKFQIEPIVRAALAEDLGPMGDITSNSVLDKKTQVEAKLVAREEGVMCGIDLAQLSFALLNEKLNWTTKKNDGEKIDAGETLAIINGSAVDILAAERTAVNFLTHLCGIATKTAKMVALAGNTKIYCTRKTTPNLRSLEKYAVQCGGGHNHRFGLSDGILIKDNHLALAPSIAHAIAAAKNAVNFLTKIEVEADNIEMVEEIIAGGADGVLLDNMSVELLSQAVELVNGRIITEASGRISLHNVAAVAKSGVDIISSGALTHSALGLDIGLDVEAI